MQKSLIVFKIPFEEPAWLLVQGSRVSFDSEAPV